MQLIAQLRIHWGKFLCHCDPRSMISQRTGRGQRRERELNSRHDTVAGLWLITYGNPLFGSDRIGIKTHIGNKLPLCPANEDR